MNGIRGLIGFITFFLPQTAFKAIRWIIYQPNLGLCWSVGVRAHRGARSGYLGCSPNGTWVLWDECWVTWRVVVVVGGGHTSTLLVGKGRTEEMKEGKDGVGGEAGMKMKYSGVLIKWIAARCLSDLCLHRTSFHIKPNTCGVVRPFLYMTAASWRPRIRKHYRTGSTM